MLEGVVLNLQKVSQSVNDNIELMEMARAENDDESLMSIASDVEQIEKLVADMEFRRMFSGELDSANCFLDIQAGSGGTEAQDWGSMLLRMYIRYAERKGFTVEVLEQSDGEVAGIKGASLKISGDYAYGHLRTETGVHRLVRISPYDSSARRHTSFSSVWVYPVPREDGQLHFLADSNAAITKGIIALVLQTVQDQPPAAIAAADIEDALAPFDLRNQLSSNRTQGIPNMIALIRQTAGRYTG